MEEIDVLIARVKELAHRSSSKGYITHTDFLSLSEQNYFFNFLMESHIDPKKKKYLDADFILDGGHEDSDRKMIFFIPSFLNDKEVLDEEITSCISCVHIYPKNIKFADNLNHRDYLGALMKLGYERDQYGDILTEGLDGYVFINRQISSFVKDEIKKVKHTVVDVEEIPLKDCPFKQNYNEKVIHISSERIDCIIAEVFNLSRRDAQELIGKECVFVDGLTIKNNSHNLKENNRVSIRGHGKFIYLSNPKETRRGRLVSKVKIYC